MLYLRVVMVDHGVQMTEDIHILALDVLTVVQSAMALLMAPIITKLGTQSLTIITEDA